MSAGIDIAALRPGDVLQHLANGRAHVVIAANGKTATVVDTVTVSNPIEWKLVGRVTYDGDPDGR